MSNIFETTWDPAQSTDPLSWDEPRNIWVDPGNDLFRKRKHYLIAHAFAVMDLTPQHTYFVLTRNIEDASDLLKDSSFAFREKVDNARVALRPGCGDFSFPPSNVWFGVRPQNQKELDQYVATLLDMQVSHRFVVLDPLTEQLDLELVTQVRSCTCDAHGEITKRHRAYCGAIPGRHHGIDWLVIGGESGPYARRMDLTCVRHYHAQCKQAGVPLFIRQMGSAWGEDHKNIDHFPEGLQVQNIPENITPHTGR